MATDGFRTAIPFWGFIMLCGGVVYSAQLLLWEILWKPSSAAKMDDNGGSIHAAAGEDHEANERKRLISD